MTTEALEAIQIYVGGRHVAWRLGDRVWPHVAGGADGDPAPAPGGDPAPDPAGDPAPTPDPTPDPSAPKKVEMTQAELDELVSKRVAKAVKTAADEAKTAAERAKLDETERLKAEKTDAENLAKTTTEKANARLITAEVKVAAAGADVKPDRLAAFLRVADLSGIEVDDDGEVDTKAVAKAVAATLKEFPEFKTTTTGPGRGGANHNGDEPPSKPGSLEEAVTAAYA